MHKLIYPILSIILCIGVTGYGYSQAPVEDPALVEHLYGGAPIRNVKGEIIRRADVIAAYRKLHACPSTLKFTGPCPNWSLDHGRPLACGGKDVIDNLIWMHNDIKSGRVPNPKHCKDCYELNVFATNPPQPDTAKCVNKIVL